MVEYLEVSLGKLIDISSEVNIGCRWIQAFYTLHHNCITSDTRDN